MPIRTLSVCLLSALCAAAWAGAVPGDWVARIRRDHPRLFINKDTWPAVKARALGPEREYYAAIKRRVDRYPDNPQGDSGGPVRQQDEKIAGKTYKMPIAKPAKEWGIQALETALVYRVTGDRKYLDRARKMLEVSVKVYHQCYKERRAVNWYSTTRVCALTAYDWLYNDLTPAQRRAIIVPFLQHVDDVQPGRGKPRIYRCNTSNYTTGFYGVRNLLWFAGLAAYGDGFDDARALRFLREGYQRNLKMFRHREKYAGDDGGLASPTVGYAMCAYPWAEFNFLHTWRSAIGENLAPQWPHLAYFPVWVMWNWIPTGGRPKEFGAGDTYHYDNNLPWWELGGHMRQIMHFYGRSFPRCAALAAYVRSRCSLKQFTRNWVIYPFLMTDEDQAPPPLDAGRMKLYARHFEGMGQIFMRSGWGPDDTYCLFTAGSKLPQHKHYDEGGFVIYKKGFLALDTGTRGLSRDFNLRHYYSQTVAHNCVLIHMPGEPLPPYWGPRYPGSEGRYNYGGMNKPTGSRVAAFETNELFTYAACDATPCYSDKKCRLALRQLVFVMPDYFLIFDRIESVKPEYKKQWLLHTQNEPQIEGRRFRADEGQGRLFCLTLLPKDAQLAKVGGPGKEFWANGINWELNDAVKRMDARQRKKTGKGMLWGHWRVEVTPGAPRTRDAFLHFIQVGDQASLARMTPCRLVERDGAVGARFEAGGMTVEVQFAAQGAPGGHIRIVSAGKTLVDRDLTTKVQPQAGLGL